MPFWPFSSFNSETDATSELAQILHVVNMMSWEGLDKKSSCIFDSSPLCTYLKLTVLRFSFIIQNKARRPFWSQIWTFIMDSKINQLKKLSTGWSNFANISLRLGDMNDFHEIINLDQPPLGNFCNFVTKSWSKLKISWKSFISPKLSEILAKFDNQVDNFLSWLILESMMKVQIGI